MKMLKNWKIKENIIKVLKTYPIVLACFFVIGAFGVFLIHNAEHENLILKINFSLTVFLGFALILRAVKLSYEKFSSKTHIILLIVCALLSAGYYFTIDPDVEWTIIRTIIILFIEGLLFISLPFIKNDEKAEHFANSAAGRLIISGILFGIAYGGIAGILFALEELFGLNISDEIYQDVGAILATTFLPMLWLFGLNYKLESSTSRLYKVLLCFVCIPLLFVYSAVVYGFIIKIIVDGFVMPSSMIGHLVLWYSFASIVVMYLARPYKDNSLTQFFYKWYPLISVLPIVIMFIAAFMRINQYAITINRYYLLLGGVYLAVMFGYFIFLKFAKKKRMNIITTLVLAFFALISIVEPISADTIAKNSQIKRLENTVSHYLENNALDVSQMEEEDVWQAQDILRYLAYQHDGYNLEYGSSHNFDDDISFLSKAEAKDILAVAIDIHKFIEEDFEDRNYYYADTRVSGGVMAPVDVSGYRYLLNIDSYDFNNGDIYTLDEYEIKIDVVANDDHDRIDNIIYVYKNKILLGEYSLVDIYGDKLLSQRQNFGQRISDFIYENEEKSVKIMLYDIEFVLGEEVEVIRFSGCLLLK